MRYARPDRLPYRVLELGFGAGANITFFMSIGTDYSGTEGSATAVEHVRRRFADVENFRVECCDFTKEIPFEGPFDLVVDRSSLTHNGTAAIEECLRRVAAKMRSGAKFIGIDWFSTANADFLTGESLEDHFTRTAFPAGQFRDVGIVHFSDEAHLRALLAGAGLDLERLEHKQTDTAVPNDQGRMAWWNFAAVKR
jgi:cyclopropane fatty-acyl-phospholipid synthase-like methyltransferase